MMNNYRDFFLGCGMGGTGNLGVRKKRFKGFFFFLKNLRT